MLDHFGRDCGSITGHPVLRLKQMDEDPKPTDELEIAHVLFIDVVGYSKFLIDEQARIVDELNRIIRNTSRFQSAQAAGKLIRIPTGDGMALVFFTSPEAPVQCAVEVSELLRNNEQIQVRMGIHSGPVNSVRDVNERSNVAGTGINIAQRIMDCADAGHILLSKRVAEDLGQHGRWRSKLHNLGEIEFKHGTVMSVFNLYGEGFGNSKRPSRLQLPSSTAISARFGLRSGTFWIAGVVIVIALLAIAIFAYHSRAPSIGNGAGSVREKSIAVLPFENFSDDKQDSYFADGIQDDILTALSKVADLKVISRSSVMRYRGENLDLRQIGRELNVTHVLEGSVRRGANEVRVTAQLIDARTDSHVWAEHYDRKLTDVFAIQSELAESIASELRAHISAAEKAMIAQRPTDDMQAFDLYLQAKGLITTFNDTPDRKETLLKAVRLLDEAIARDRHFSLAFCWAAIAHDNLYWFDLDHSPARLELAKSCARQALVLTPDLGEAHLAQALVWYHGYRDYEKARSELALARITLPNNADVFSLTGYIDRREGKWDASLQNLGRAAELDPRNFKVLNDLSVLYDLLRRYDDKDALYDRAVLANPASADYCQLLRAETELEKGNLAKARQLFDQLPAGYDPDGSSTVARVTLFLYQGNTAAAQATLKANTREELVGNTGSLIPRSFFEGQIARAEGDAKRTIAVFENARDKVESKLREDTENAFWCGMLAVINAGLGRKEQALAAARRAVDLRPMSKDAVDGPVALADQAMTHAWLGETDPALKELILLASQPGGPAFGELKFDPAWKDVRSDPRFQEMLNRLQPK